MIPPQRRHDEHAQQESRLPPQARPQACQSPSRWPLWIVTKCCPNLGHSSPDDYIGRRSKRDTPPSPTSPGIPSKGPSSPSPRNRTSRCYKITFQRQNKRKGRRRYDHTRRQLDVRACGTTASSPEAVQASRHPHPVARGKEVSTELPVAPPSKSSSYPTAVYTERSTSPSSGQHRRVVNRPRSSV